MGGLGVLVALFAPASAHAGTYTVYACKKPDGTPAPAEGWRVEAPGLDGNSLTIGPESCATGGPMRNEFKPGVNYSHGHYANWEFAAASPSLPVVGYVVYRAAGVLPTSPGRFLYGLFERQQAGGIAWPEQCDQGGPCAWPPSAQPPLSENSARARGGVRLVGYGVQVRCEDTDPDPNVNHCGAQTSRPAWADIHRAETILEDTTDPEFSSPPSGTMFDTGRPLSGVVQASFSARDAGSGVFQSIVEVDGRPVATAIIDDNDKKCVLPFVHRVPCKPSAAGTAALDTNSLEDGQHNVRLLVTDATRSNTIAYGPILITTKNRSPGRGAPNGTNAADGARITARWRGRKRRELRTAFNRTVAVTGTLRDPIGRPITGATVEIAGRELRLAAGERILRRVTTRADGTFTYRFRARPGMSLSARYRAFANDPGYASEDRLTLRVRAGVTIKTRRVVRRGTRLVATGRLRGGPIPRGGKSVVLQVLDGRTWRDVDETKTDRRGRFKASERVRPGGGRVTLRLRILVRRDQSYPYSLGTSRVRRVLVVP